MTDFCEEALESAWRSARASGSLGSASIEELCDHAAGFIPGPFGVEGRWLGVDLGTGAGVPGVLLALAHRDSRWLLIDSNQRNCGYASAAVAAMGLGGRVEVRHSRAEDLAREPEWRGSVDLVVSRLFGDPAEVAECGVPLLRLGGRLVVSSTSATEARWIGADLSVVGAEVSERWKTSAGRYLSVERVDVGDEGYYPRRAAARQRRPLF